MRGASRPLPLLNPFRDAELTRSTALAGTGSAQSTLTGSSSSTSLASTIREKGATLLRALVDPSRRDEEPQPGPAAPVEPAPPADMLVPLNDVEPSDDDDQSSATEDDDNGGIRLVSSRSTVADTTMASLDSPPPALPTSTPAFIFGSPSSSAAPPASAFTFSSTMPGTLFASTSSTSSALADQPPATESAATSSTMSDILAEMNRRAAESRATAPLPRSGSTLFGSSSSARPASPSKGSKAAFDLDHKRRFDRMDSITTHWAAKRALPASSSGGNLAGTARSGSSRSIAAAAAGVSDAPERAPKRLKPSTSRPVGLSRLASSTAASSSSSAASSGAATDQKLVAALRNDGWSAAPPPKGAVSLSASIRSAAQPARAAGGGGGGLKGVREDILPREEQERAQKKRQMELAKARRKSGAASGMGLSRRRPSLGVGRASLFLSFPRLDCPTRVVSDSTLCNSKQGVRLDGVAPVQERRAQVHALDLVLVDVNSPAGPASPDLFLPAHTRPLNLVPHARDPVSLDERPPSLRNLDRRLRLAHGPLPRLAAQEGPAALLAAPAAWPQEVRPPGVAPAPDELAPAPRLGRGVSCGWRAGVVARRRAPVGSVRRARLGGEAPGRLAAAHGVEPRRQPGAAQPGQGRARRRRAPGVGRGQARRAPARAEHAFRRAAQGGDERRRAWLGRGRDDAGPDGRVDAARRHQEARPPRRLLFSHRPHHRRHGVHVIHHGVDGALGTGAEEEARLVVDAHGPRDREGARQGAGRRARVEGEEGARDGCGERERQGQGQGESRVMRRAR